jgi:uncharacterized protein (DUF2236 family)
MQNRGRSHPMPGLLSPNSVAWRVNRESILLLGARRALLMQIAHPLIAAAVADHSDFENDPFGRLRRTVETMLALTFGDEDLARAAFRRVDAIHSRVQGRLSQAARGFEAGAPYDAHDPELLFWVHATLVDTAMLVYRRYVGRLLAGEEEQYYQETKAIARLFSVPDSLIPDRLGDFRAYVNRMVECGPVAVSATGRRLAENIFYPPVPLMPSAVFRAINLVTIGLLPPTLREQFGLRWNQACQLMFDASAVWVRIALALLPDVVRANPAARAAERSARSTL